jgi:hypothetical protein
MKLPRRNFLLLFCVASRIVHGSVSITEPRTGKRWRPQASAARLFRLAASATGGRARCVTPAPPRSCASAWVMAMTAPTAKRAAQHEIGRMRCRRHYHLKQVNHKSAASLCEASAFRCGAQPAASPREPEYEVRLHGRPRVCLAACFR